MIAVSLGGNAPLDDSIGERSATLTIGRVEPSRRVCPSRDLCELGPKTSSDEEIDDARRYGCRYSVEALPFTDRRATAITGNSGGEADDLSLEEFEDHADLLNSSKA
ncbi:MAG: hypothetical protein ACOVQ6_09285, partial [Brevundimonas sp.]